MAEALRTGSRRLALRVQGWLFVALLLAAIGLIAWLSTRYAVESDWTAAGRNTLTPASRQLLDTLDQPLTLTAFVRPGALTRGRIEDLLARYRRARPALTLEVVNPDLQPERVRREGIEQDGTVVIRYAGRREVVTDPTETTLTNALWRLSRTDVPQVRFLAGHGERDPTGNANYDLGQFGEVLAQRGLPPRPLNLARAESLPADTALLVIAGPQLDLPAREVGRVLDYLDAGGNLLWLADPGPPRGLAPLAERLGIAFRPGIIVDTLARQYGIDSPGFALAADYPAGARLGDFKLLTLYPRAAALDATPVAGWRAEPLAQTAAGAWNETGPLTGEIRPDATGEDAGPLTLGVMLTRGTGRGEQRVVVMGDGDFLANAYLGNGGNRALGLALFNWLVNDDRLITLPTRTAVDPQLNLSPAASSFIGFTFLLGLPGLFLASGLVIRWRRQRR